MFRMCVGHYHGSQRLKLNVKVKTWLVWPRSSIEDSILVVTDVIASSPSTHHAYPRRDVQAELEWVAGYVLRWFACLDTVNHLSTTWADTE